MTDQAMNAMLAVARRAGQCSYQQKVDTMIFMRQAYFVSGRIGLLADVALPLSNTGLGEPAPAIGNATYAAVGARLNRPPMCPADVLLALKSACASPPESPATLPHAPPQGRIAPNANEESA